MTLLNEYLAWFQTEAGKLPYEVRRSVLGALANKEPWQVFRRLRGIWERGELRASWKPTLDDFYWRFC